MRNPAIYICIYAEIVLGANLLFETSKAQQLVRYHIARRACSCNIGTKSVPNDVTAVTA